MAEISINGVTVDPLAGADRDDAAGAVGGRGVLADTAGDASGSNYLLVQVSGPLSPEQMQDLRDLGLTVLQYVPQDTYIVRYEGTDLTAIRGRDYVIWANPYLRDFKIGPSLRPPRGPAESTRDAGTRADSDRLAPSRTPREVDVILQGDVALEQVRDAVAAAAGVTPDMLTTGTNKFRVVVEQGRLDDLADIDEVAHLEPVPRRKLFNNVAGRVLHSEPLVAGVPLTGEGQVVAVADTGFDKGSVTDVHPAFKGRVARLYDLGRPDRTDDPHGHGTHVCGSVLGAGESATMGGAIRGTAPAATLVMQSTLDAQGGLGGLPADLHDLFEPPYTDDGARVHSNSWGSVRPGTPYDASAAEIDDTVWNHPDLVIVFAAGNDGTDQDRDGVIDHGQIGSQSAAKNCITVGASESLRPEFAPTYGTYWPRDYPTAPISTDKQADNPDGMAAFSSRGPTREGRIKPDVVAPGTCILSTLSRAVVTPGTDFGVSSDPAFFFDTGTSMATPLVSGCIAALRQGLGDDGVSAPTAALIKALLITGAVELPGQYQPSEAGASPNPDSGWGRVDLQRAVPGGAAGPGFAEAGPLAQGDEHTLTVPAPDSPAQALVVTLVWTDPAGAALQNDLDLIVSASDGTERHGNMGTGDGFDRVNNVEQVRWTAPPEGDLTVTVRAHRITRFSQPFAVAWRWD